MASQPRLADKLRFDGFELDVRAGELRKHGVRLRLRGQPLRVLEILLERPGEVVTRDELQSRIWSADTFVDFDHALHNAIARIREVLGDSAETPRYIDTVPRRGYRFVGAVESLPTVGLAGETGQTRHFPVELAGPAGQTNGGGLPLVHERPKIAPAHSGNSTKWPWAVSGALAMASIALVVLLRRGTVPEEKPLMRLSIDLSPEAMAIAGPRSTPVISPDASRLAFPVRTSDGKQLLATRRLDQESTTLLAGTDNAVDPFFSPDSQWIGFFAGGKMKKVSVQGGPPINICDTGEARGASWGEDGNIIFTGIQTYGGLSRVSENGGTPQTLTTPAQGEYSHRWPQILPGGQSVLFSSTGNPWDNWDDASVCLLSLKTGQWKAVQREGYFGRYVPTSDKAGHLLYVHRGTLFAVAFDPVRAEVKGNSFPVLENLAIAGLKFGNGNFSFSSNGVFVYVPGGGSQGLPLALIEQTGKVLPLLPPAPFSGARFSPDGKRIALAIPADIYVHDREHDRTTRMTFSRANANPVWAPDGKHLVFQHAGEHIYSLQWIRADGAGQTQTLMVKGTLLVPSSFSPDGKYLAYTDVGAGNQQEVWVLPLELTDPNHPHPGKPQAIDASHAANFAPAFSQDGKWIAYSSFESGRTEVYVRPFPLAAGGEASKTQVSAHGGEHPIWSRTSRELFFDTTTGELMVASYKITGHSFEVDKPRLWSDTRIVPSSGVAQAFDVAPGGRQVMALVSSGSSSDRGTSVHVDVLLNFFDEIRRRASTAK